MKKTITAFLIFCILAPAMSAPGQSIGISAPGLQERPGLPLLPGLQTLSQTLSQTSTDIPAETDPSRLRLVIGTGAGVYAGTVSYMSFVWYRDKERVPFHFYNDGKGFLQVDKFGHAYAAYWESMVAYKALRWAGIDKRRALLWGGPAGFVFQAPIEILDGMHEGYGFSWWDVAANGFGSVLFTFQQAVFDEQVVLMKFSYAPSKYPKYHHELGKNPFDRFFLDYNAHTYWFSANLRRLTGITAMPAWLNFAYGYSANGMIGEFENPTTYMGQPFPHFDRHRQHIISLDIDLSRIPVKSKWARTMLNVANTIKIPFPALEINRTDDVQFRPLYF